MQRFSCPAFPDLRALHEESVCLEAFRQFEGAVPRLSSSQIAQADKIEPGVKLGVVLDRTSHLVDSFGVWMKRGQR